MKMPLVHWVMLLAVAAVAFAIGFSGGAIEPKLPDGESSGERVEMPSPHATSEPSGAASESPREALLRATSHPSELRRTHALLEWIQGLRPEKYADAAAIAISLPPEQAKEALRLLYAAWAEHDPRGAIEDSRTRPNVPPEISEHVLREWGRRDLAATLEWLIEAGNPTERIGDFYSLEESLLELAREDPTAMYRLLARPEIAASIRNMREIIGVLAERDPAGAVRQAQALPSGERRQALSAVMERWGAQAPRDALAWLASQPGDSRSVGELRGQLIRAWAGSDAVAAGAYAQALGPGPLRDAVLSQVAVGMLAKDPVQAAKAAREVPLATLLEEENFFRVWSRTDAPSAGRALAERLKIEGAIEASLRDIRWAAASVFESWAGKDPAGAAAFAITQESVLRDRILPEAVRILSRQNRSAALAWVQGLPASEGRRIAYEAAAAEWAAWSTNEVAAWLPSVPRGADYAAAVTGFAGRAFAADPASALEWLRTIPDAAARERALKAAWAYWSQQHSYMPMEWLETSPELTPGERAVLKRKDGDSRR